METTEVLLALRIIAELTALVDRAARGGPAVTKKEITLAFTDADAAEAKWHKVYDPEGANDD
jgi:hypothetical protein